MTKTTSFFWLILGAIVVSSGCGSGEAAESAANESAASVEVVVVTTHAFGTRLEIPANVLPMKQVQIIPRVPGVIEDVLVDEGEWVEEGQILARLEQRDYHLAVRQAQANLASARANAKLAGIMSRSASTQHGRMESLLENGAVAQSKAEQAQDGLLMSQAKSDAAQAQVAQAQVGLDAARIKLAYTVVEAPYAGLVIKRMMDAGEIAGAMPPGILMILADTKRMKVEGSINELDLVRIKAGALAAVRVDALGGEEIAGTVELVSPMVDPRTRTAGVRVVLDNADGRLETGMSAEIVLDLGRREAPAIPGDAVIRSGAGRGGEVFVVAQGKAQRRQIRLGLREGELVEVVEGLSPGEQVVRSGWGALTAGQPVVVATEGAE